MDFFEENLPRGRESARLLPPCLDSIMKQRNLKFLVVKNAKTEGNRYFSRTRYPEQK